MTEIAEETEQIKLAYISANEYLNNTEITEETLQAELESNGNNVQVTTEVDSNGNKGLLVKFTDKDRTYFVQEGQVREVEKEEFSKEVTPVYAILYSDGDFRFNTTGKINETKIANGDTAPGFSFKYFINLSGDAKLNFVLPIFCAIISSGALFSSGSVIRKCFFPF